MSARRTISIAVIGGFVIVLQLAHGVLIWLTLWQVSARDCATNPGLCDDDTGMLILFGVLPQLLFLSITVPFVIWFIATVIGNRGRLA